MVFVAQESNLYVGGISLFVPELHEFPSPCLLKYTKDSRQEAIQEIQRLSLHNFPAFLPRANRQFLREY